VELSLGRRADYSLRAVLHLARHEEDARLHPAREIAAAMDVPVTWLPQLLSALVTAGIVESVTGRSGGHRLARPAGEITLLEVVDAVEPERVPTCVLRGGPCSWEGRCAFHEPWAAAKQALRDRLAATTFAAVMAHDPAGGAGLFVDESDEAAG
jgi:Rrf2 family protein